MSITKQRHNAKWTSNSEYKTNYDRIFNKKGEKLLSSLIYKNMKAKKLVQKAPVLGSSANPEELSMTIKGIILGIIPLLAILNSWFGINIEEQGVRALADSVQSVIVAAWGLWSACLVLYGLVRKAVIFIKTYLENKK